MAPRGSRSGSCCAAWEFWWRVVDGGLSGPGRRAKRGSAGGHAASRRPDRASARRRLRSKCRTPRPSRRAHGVDGCCRHRRERPALKRSRARPLRRAQRAALLFRLRQALPSSAGRPKPRDHRLGRGRIQTCSRGGILRPAVHRTPHMGRPTHGRSEHRADQASGQHVLRGRPGQRQPIGPRHRGGLHAYEAGSACGACATRRLGPSRIWLASHAPRWSSTPSRTPGYTRRTRSAFTTRWPARTSRRYSIDSDHYFTTPGARSEQADIIAKWIAKRWR